ncbi:lytic transglycosylase [Sinisalibacter lacisalsi]|uniref:Lytic transglycosylase n=2 Tax=Sinisalibacter lacisalsi TaxID=1526570 RepID=A0ABQ1QMJ8_9RHOB|nr:lytic transglycosylase [Sinisalibacter lacisalsi]
MVRKMKFLLRLVLAPALFALGLSAPAAAQDAAEVAALERGLELMRSGDWDGALAAAGPPGSVARDIVQWNRLRASRGEFSESLDFLRRNPDWPGLALLRERSEKTIPEDASAAAVLDFFIAQKPETGLGSLRFAQALWDTGAKQEAMAEAIRGWTSFGLSQEEEDQFMVDWPQTLASHHWARMDMLLWRGLTAQAERQMARVDAAQQALARARIALRNDENGVDALIAAVPTNLASDPGLAYERFLWRARKGRNADAIELLLERSDTAASLGRPEAWASWRSVLARWAMREDDGRTAYRIAASHQIADDSEDRSELEWLAGYIALRKLGDAETALRHFRDFKGGVESPISLGRAGYWEGRALEALGRAEEARAAYTRAGQHQSAFYGILAAEKAGIAMDAALTGAETFPGYQQAAFWNTTVMQAARLLLAAEERYLAERMVIQLSEGLDRTGLGQLMQWAEDANAPYLQLKLAKYALRFHGTLLNRPYFPTPEIGSGNRTVTRALEMAIARRESEFDPGARSGVGALGLMQLMPGTAQDMARRLDIDHAPARLTSEMAYNTRLGSEYLAYLIEQFGRNPVLIAVAYNAGPGRARSWSERMGNPGDPAIDVIDWIEHIPFTETRNYVMRVTESLPNYRARLTGQTEAIAFTQELKRR